MLTTTIEPLGLGAENDSTSDVIRKFLNPALKGRGWDSMIAALAAGDQTNWNNARFAFSQLFLSTADGAYLDRRAGDQGIERPPGVNMSDGLFRKLAIVEKTTKLTQEALLEVLEVYYGIDATRASMTSAVSEPFMLSNGDDLQILLDERTSVTITFSQSHFSNINSASAEEVAAEITRDLATIGSQAFAISFTDPTTNLSFVKIYSGARGLTSGVRIIGGRANTHLLFPQSIFTTSGSTPFAVWHITLSPTTPGNLRFTETSGIYDLFQVREGDLAYIYGPEFGACNCDGTFTIEAVSVSYSGINKIQWFEIKNPSGVAVNSISQTLFTDLMFFRPVRKSVYDNSRHVIVCENNDHLDVVVPATTEVVGRGPGLAAYLNGQSPISVSSLTRTPDGTVTIVTSSPHGLVAGNQIVVDHVYPSDTQPSTVSGTPSGAYSGNLATGTTDASIKSTASASNTYAGVYSRVGILPTGEMMIVGGRTQTDSVTFTSISSVQVYSKTSESILGNGGVRQSYQWQRIPAGGTAPNFVAYSINPRNFGMSVLADGRVLATGGSTNDDASAAGNGWDLLQYVSGTIVQTTGTLPAARASHGQASLAGGDAIISGGWTVVGTMLASTYRFSVTSLTWAAKAAMVQARMHHQLVPLTNGLVLAIGGQDAIRSLNACELYDPSGDTWTTTGSMADARINFATTTVPDGRVIVFGGRGYNPTRSSTPVVLSSVEIYNPSSGLWSSLPPMLTAREYPVVAYLASKNAIIVSGGDSSRIDLLHVNTMKWTQMLGSANTHTVSAGGLASNDSFVVLGGLNGTATAAVNTISVPGTDVFGSGAGLNHPFEVQTVPNGTTLTVKNTDFDFTGTYFVAAAGVTITALGALAAPAGIPGPFSYDTKAGLPITAANAVTKQDLNRGGNYASLHLDTAHVATPALAFPDSEGFLVFNFGFDNVVGPVRYLGRLSDQDLILDASVPFPKTLPSGVTVRLLSSREPFEPAPDRLVGNFYVTGTAAGRVAAQKTIDDIVAAGKQILVTVVYPGDRGLGAEGFPQSNAVKLSDKVEVWAGDDLDLEIAAARASQ